MYQKSVGVYTPSMSEIESTHSLAAMEHHIDTGLTGSVIQIISIEQKGKMQEEIQSSVTDEVDSEASSANDLSTAMETESLADAIALTEVFAEEYTEPLDTLKHHAQVEDEECIDMEALVAEVEKDEEGYETDEKEKGGSYQEEEFALGQYMKEIRKGKKLSTEQQKECARIMERYERQAQEILGGNPDGARIMIRFFRKLASGEGKYRKYRKYLRKSYAPDGTALPQEEQLSLLSAKVPEMVKLLKANDMENLVRQLGEFPLASTRLRRMNDELKTLDAGESGPLHDPQGTVPERTERVASQLSQRETARRELAESSLRLVVSIAKQFRYKGLSFLDLIEEGNKELMHVADKFEPRLGNAFTTYASTRIARSISRAVANQSRTIRIPVHRAQEIGKIYATKKKLTQTLLREPSDEEISKLTGYGKMEQREAPKRKGISPAEVRFLLQMTRYPVQCSTPLNSASGETTYENTIVDTRNKSPSEFWDLPGFRQYLMEKIFPRLTYQRAVALSLHFELGFVVTGDPATNRITSIRFDPQLYRKQHFQEEIANLVPRADGSLEGNVQHTRVGPVIKNGIKQLRKIFKDFKY